jgi:hypothetical protein
VSIIVALASARDGIVGSDGRRFSSAIWERGVVTVPPRIERDDFDKTFALNNGRVVGAFCGLLEFGGLTVGNHVQHIVEPLLLGDPDLRTLTNAVRSGLSTRLRNINDQEVVFDSRKLDLILVGGRNLSRAEMCIVAFRFSPSNGRIESTMKEALPDKSRKRYYVLGDDEAGSAASKFFENDRSPSLDARVLEHLVRTSIARGIESSGKGPNGQDPACGGTIFTKRTCY